MGVGLGSRNCPSAPMRTTNAPNPDPKVFTVVRTEMHGFHCVALVHYKNCTNFEGNKICLFLDTPYKDLLNAKVLDPHFQESGLTPFARFRPDGSGWNAAIILATEIQK